MRFLAIPALRESQVAEPETTFQTVAGEIRMLMWSRCVLALMVLSIATMLGCVSSNNSNATSIGFVWVATKGDQMINAYTISLTSGATSHIGNGIDAGAQPTAMAITPDGKTLFVGDVDDNCGSNLFCNQVRVYSVNADGSLTTQGTPVQITSPTASPQGMGLAMSVDSTGAVLLVASQGNAGVLGQTGSIPGTISVFSISGSALSAVPNSPFSSAVPGDVTGNGPSGIAVSPGGSFVYVANQFTNTVAGFVLDASAGTFTFNGSYNVGSNPSGLAFSRCAGVSTATTNCPSADASTLFVANSGSNDISEFNACIQASTTCGTPNGTLVPVSTSATAAGISPVAFIVNPVVNFVYAVDARSNQISQYRYNSATGALTSLAPAAVSTSSTPAAGGITGDGSFLLVPDTGASSMSVFSVGSATSNTGTPPNGRLAPAAAPSVLLTGQPSAMIVR
jgi:6-phosphogluconolactonase (cycloisomerase 2 family)